MEEFESSYSVHGMEFGFPELVIMCIRAQRITDDAGFRAPVSVTDEYLAINLSPNPDDVSMSRSITITHDDTIGKKKNWLVTAHTNMDEHADWPAKYINIFNKIIEQRRKNRDVIWRVNL